jgi:two-component system, cell cycle response regulator
MSFRIGHRNEQTGRALESRRPQKVLVVEDDEHDREIYGKILWYNGYDVEYAGNAGEALEHLIGDGVDLVVLDLGLPMVDGLDLCRALKNDPRTAEIPVLVLSARSEREYGARAHAAGCCRYLEKPKKPLEVLEEVEQVVGPAPRPD